MQVTAKARNLKISAQKLRLQTDGLRGTSAQKSLMQLSVRPQKGSAMVFEAVKSALHNATNNNNLIAEDMIIREIYVDEGTRLKRWIPRSRGMAAPRIHPKAHLTVVLGEQAKPAKTVKEAKGANTSAKASVKSNKKKGAK